MTFSPIHGALQGSEPRASQFEFGIANAKQAPPALRIKYLDGHIQDPSNGYTAGVRSSDFSMARTRAAAGCSDGPKGSAFRPRPLVRVRKPRDMMSLQRMPAWSLIWINRPAASPLNGSWLPNRLAGHGRRSHAPGMFVVSEAEASAIRAAFDRGGELSAAVELRRLFPGVADMAQARECARTIACWRPLPVRPRQWTRRDPRRAR
jgi:hypothetical protein